MAEAAAVEGVLGEDFDIVGVAKVFEIFDGDDSDVGGVVPVKGEGGGGGCFSLEKDLGAELPEAKVGESDDDFFADSEHFIEEKGGFLDFLEGLAEQD